MDKIDLLSLELRELEDVMIELGESKFRAKQVFEWVHLKKTSDFDEMSNISVQLKEKLKEKFCTNLLNIQKKLVSDTDDTVKYLYRLCDGEQIETVLMKYKYGYSVCISTQVGCKMSCAFCASGLAGFVRNLTAGEILAQVYETERDSGATIGNIVLMGIGEPLDNYDNVLKFLRIVSNQSGRNMSHRHISLSTSGLADKIEELAELKLGITLSVSLHSPFDEKRSKIMPVNKAFPIKKLMDACKIYFEKTGRRISFEYALINGVNDDRDSAEELIKLVKPLRAHINLIPVNTVRETGFKKSSRIKDFADILTAGGVNATVRRTLGSGIDAACGQLRRNNL